VLACIILACIVENQGSHPKEGEVQYRHTPCLHHTHLPNPSKQHIHCVPEMLGHHQGTCHRFGVGNIQLGEVNLVLHTRVSGPLHFFPPLIPNLPSNTQSHLAPIPRPIGEYHKWKARTLGQGGWPPRQGKGLGRTKRVRRRIHLTLTLIPTLIP